MQLPLPAAAVAAPTCERPGSHGQGQKAVLDLDQPGVQVQVGFQVFVDLIAKIFQVSSKCIILNRFE